MDKILKHCCSAEIIRRLGISAAAVYLSILLLKWRKQRYFRNKAAQLQNYEKLAIEKRLQTLKNSENMAADEIICMDEESDEILCMDAISLISAAKQAKLVPIKILRAYLSKACLLTQQYNCVTGIINNVEQIADGLNEKAAEDCMLYGLPVSLKESMKTKGMDCTIGLSCFVGIPALDDCVIAKVLKHCGAIPFVKTNLPQMMLSFESSNPIYGETSNPLNVEFTPGGSSSGEASLIGGGGSPLGFGTDIAGSIRVPAHMCGITGLKPTMNRLSKLGLNGSLPGQSLVSSSIGPMAKDVDTLVLAMQALLCPLMFKLDLNIAPMPFDENIYRDTKKLCIGYYVDDGYNEPIPAIKRAVNLAKIALMEAGHTLVPFKVPRIEDAMRLLTSAIHADGGRTNLTRLKYDAVDQRLQNVYQRWKYSRLTRFILSSITGYKWPRAAEQIDLCGGGDSSVFRLWKLQTETAKYKDDFFSAWRDQGLDAIICPPFPVVACPKGSVENMEALMSYTALYNLLNCPGGVVPVTKVNVADTEALNSHAGHYGDIWDRKIKEACKRSLGMPVGVQCVALPWQDEMCLRVMKEVESLVAYH